MAAQKDSVVISKRPACVYIDGFNLFYSLKDNGWRHYYWLNIFLLAKQLVGDEHELRAVKYFTSPIDRPFDKKERQSRYLNALRSLDRVSVIEGYHQKKKETYHCDSCGVDKEIEYYVEKRTDVNIATAILCDSFTDKYDKAIVITADNDLCGPIQAYRKIHKGHKKIIVALPPKRPGVLEPFQLKNSGNKSIQIEEEHVKKALMDKYVMTIGGTVICPDGWLPLDPNSTEAPTISALNALANKFNPSSNGR